MKEEDNHPVGNGNSITTSYRFNIINVGNMSITVEHDPMYDSSGINPYTVNKVKPRSQDFLK